jgi:hypothetical protein
MKKLVLGLFAVSLFCACKKDDALQTNTQVENAELQPAAANAAAVQKKFLFDATKAQTAGNADWILDADNGTIKRFPTPAQSGITSSTSENFWQGANSAWGVDLVKQGHLVEQLPPGTAITYGTSAVQDLKNYDVYIVTEPNVRYTSAEKTAILNFVKNGGGLFMIADHNISDRNNDGWDSPNIYNDLFSNNSVATDPFGFKYNLDNFSQTTSNRLSATTNPILNGATGSVSSLKYSAGASMAITKTTVAKGLIWKTGVAQASASVMAIQATFGTGRVVALGDSSPADDGTGQPGNNLFFGWTELSGAHRKLHINGSLWLAKL